MHANSLAANQTGRTGSFTQREREILSALNTAGRPMTDREIMRALGHFDMNCVRPRITELIDAGALHETGQRIDPATGKTVRLVSVLAPRTHIHEAGTQEHAEQLAMFFAKQGAA
jgi:hypothetical protein